MSEEIRRDKTRKEDGSSSNYLSRSEQKLLKDKVKHGGARRSSRKKRIDQQQVRTHEKKIHD